jgi:hypothetical protein
MDAVEFLDNDSRFTLTGSRYWAALSDKIAIAPDTDWDYVTEYSEELVQELLSKGFTSKNPEWSNERSAKVKWYIDATTVVVLYLGNIQVILKRKVHMYLELQSLISVDFYIRYLWKRHMPVSIIQAFYSLMLTEVK